MSRAAADVDEAAQIWAEATTERDGGTAVPELDHSRPVIEAVIDSSPRSFLLMAYDPQSVGAGFAAVAPVEEAQDEIAELRYLGVRPRAWGGGVARSLLSELPARAEELGFRRLQLSVYADNERAVELYRRLGWQADGEPVPHQRSGRLEQRYRLDV